MQVRKYVAEALGTALLVLIAVGVATLNFGFKLDGGSVAAGVVTTALAFGLVLLALAYTLGPISGAHVNPAVTLGFLLSGRLGIAEAVGYWVSQFVGGIIGAVALWGMVSGAHGWSSTSVGLGADGFGRSSLIGINWGAAFLTEVLLTFAFVVVVLIATSRIASAGFAGLAIGLALTSVHLVGIPLTGTSVNPARALAAAIFSGSHALGQVWLFIVAPLVGAVLAALAYRFFVPEGAAMFAPAETEQVPSTGTEPAV